MKKSLKSIDPRINEILAHTADRLGIWISDLKVYRQPGCRRAVAGAKAALSKIGF